MSNPAYFEARAERAHKEREGGKTFDASDESRTIEAVGNHTPFAQLPQATTRSESWEETKTTAASLSRAFPSITSIFAAISLQCRRR